MTYQIDLSNKTALITGGTRGIGAAITDLFAQVNADIIFTGTKEDDVSRRVDELKSETTSNVEGWVADLTNPNNLDDICNRIKSLSHLHILINNAGINHILPIDRIKGSDFKKILSLNLHAPAILSGAAATLMKRQQWGRIVNIASIWSVITKPGRAMYTASKFGLVGLTKTTALDLSSDNILVNSLSPGFTKTELTDTTVPEDEQEQIARQIPLGRFADPDEIARVALFLCSDLNTYITAQNIVADGGFVSA